MHNIHELEKKWLNYKIKSFIPYLSIFIILIIATILFLNIDINNFKSKEETVETKETVVVAKPIEKIELKEQNKVALLKIETIDDTPNKVILTPSLDFIKKLRNDSTGSYSSNDFSSQNNRDQKKKTIKKTEPKKVAKVYRKDVEKKRKPLDIKRQETQADIQHVIKRFKKNNNPALSLFVAKKYYRMGDYNKAYNYALVTNELNNEIDDSWIIFSKSLVKLGKKDKAIKVLTKYIEHSHSSNAKVLLDNITSGKFKWKF